MSKSVFHPLYTAVARAYRRFEEAEALQVPRRLALAGLGVAASTAGATAAVAEEVRMEGLNGPGKSKTSARATNTVRASFSHVVSVCAAG